MRYAICHHRQRVTEMAFLTIDHLLFSYGSWQLCADVTLKENSCTAIIGSSGAGKSTLLSLIAGFEIPKRGAIYIDGTNITSLPPAKRPVTMLFQDNNLFAHLSLFRNIGLGRDPGLRLSKSDHNSIKQAITEVGLTGLENRLPHAVSGGDRQRAALARCLCQNRPVLLLDEPFNSLDPAARQEMIILVNQLRHDQNLTVLIVTHNPAEVAEIADSAIFMSNGTISECGEISELLENPKTPELEYYLRSPNA